MLKPILAALAILYAGSALAAVDVNKAAVADLDAIKGIGPALSQRILQERRKGDFKNWEDLMVRVKGIGQATAARYSAGGLTVNGQEYRKVAPAAKKDGKPGAAAVPAAAPGR